MLTVKRKLILQKDLITKLEAMELCHQDLSKHEIQGLRVVQLN